MMAYLKSVSRLSLARKYICRSNGCHESGYRYYIATKSCDRKSGAKKVLMGAGISFIIIIAVMIFHLMKNADMQGGKPPIPLMIVFTVLAAWSLYVAIVEDSTE